MMQVSRSFFFLFMMNNGKHACDRFEQGGWCVRGVYKIVFALIILVVALTLGGIAARLHQVAWSRPGVMMGSEFRKALPGSPLRQDRLVLRGGMMRSFEEGEERFFDNRVGDATSTIRVFGAITKIEANKITLADNGAKSQVVLSQASTVITSSFGYVPLKMVKVGQVVGVSGTATTDGMILAKMIRLY